MDAKILETHKENILPLPNGRPALKLGLSLKEIPTKVSLLKKRQEFEDLLRSDESDDHLQDYIDYISWIQNAYILGNTFESGLLSVLERCTLVFRDTSYYKNDARYLKVWLHYAEFSELPRDIFVYLARKCIGLQLALYYEEFAKYLELNNQIADAREVYEVGIEREARPLPRLMRSFLHFKERSKRSPHIGDSNIRSQVLRQGPSAASIIPTPARKKQKLSVHTDEHQLGFKDRIFQDNSSPDLALITEKARENRVPITPWSNAKIEQQASSEPSRAAKFEVFRDSNVDNKGSETGFEVTQINGEYFTMMKQTGRPTERLCANLALFYPAGGQELCLSERLAKAATAHKKSLQTQKTPVVVNDSINRSQKHHHKASQFASSTQQDPFTEHNYTFTIPLRDEDTVHRPKSPTITMVLRSATNEVLQMFNDAARNVQLEDELFKTFEESTDYEGFVTETLDTSRAHNRSAPQHSDTPSSPFMERPI